MACTIQELRNILLCPTSGIMVFPVEDYDEVFPGIVLSDCWVANDVTLLRKLNVGSVLNAAYGTDASVNMVYVDPEEYASAGIRFLGIPALDLTAYPLHKYFEETSTFIKEGLSSSKKVLVHCKQGISRSACLVLAYLIIMEGFSVQDAARMVREKREILPNDGFIQQLCDLDSKLRTQ